MFLECWLQYGGFFAGKGSFDEPSKERMRSVGAGFEFGVSLGGDEERMSWYLNHFHQSVVW
jgi:hypothetical protein